MDIDPPILLALAGASAVALTWLLRKNATGGGPLERAWLAFEVGLGLLLMLALLYVGALQIVVRYAPAGVFYASWTEELARLLVVWATFWGAAVVQREGGHMSVDLLYDALPPRGQQILRLLSDLVVLAILCILVAQGWRIAYLQIGQTTITLGISIAAFAYAVPVGGSLMLLFLAWDLLARTRRAFARPDAASDGSV